MCIRDRLNGELAILTVRTVGIIRASPEKIAITIFPIFHLFSHGFLHICPGNQQMCIRDSFYTGAGDLFYV